jgi:putative methyltransferase
MNIQYINFQMPSPVAMIPYSYFSFKSYCNQNINDSHRINWLDPITDAIYDSTEDLINIIVSRNPQVVAFSLYIWNFEYSMIIAKAVKDRLPECLIVIGGPNLTYKSNHDYFKQNTFVDLICDIDGYGEIFFNDLISQLLENNLSPSDITHCVYPTEKRNLRISHKVFSKKEFVWPSDILDDLQLDNLVADIKKQNRIIMYPLETNRGCPYECVFCEWGGGTGTKVVFKPDEYVNAEIDIISKLGMEQIIFTDANFGIKKRDIEFVRRLCDNSKQYGFPNVVEIAGTAKNSIEHSVVIYELLHEYGLTNRIKLSVQNLDEKIKQNIKRVDLTFDEILPKNLAIKEKYNSLIEVEFILGLPGETLDSFFDTFNTLYKHDLRSVFHPWFLLPTSPAYNIDYRTQFKIELAMINAQQRGMASVEKNLMINEKIQMLPIVVETLSYSKDDWVKMRFIAEAEQEFAKDPIIIKIRNLLIKDTGISIANFMKMFYNKFLWSEKYLSNSQQFIVNGILDSLNKVKSDGFLDSISFFNIDNRYLNTETAMTIIKNKDDFYGKLISCITDEFKVEEHV